MVTKTRDPWADVGYQLTTRMAELGMTQGDLCDKTGLSRTTVRPFMNGTGKQVRDSTRAQISLAVGWTMDSIDRILQGQQPEMAGPRPEGLSLWQQALQAQVDALEVAVRDISKQLGRRH